MSEKEFSVVFSDGSEDGDFPVAVKHTQLLSSPDGSEYEENLVIDPILGSGIYGNLYGRVMTLVEATSDAHKLQAVKDLFSKELSSWADDVHNSARELARGGDSTANLYTRKSK